MITDDAKTETQAFAQVLYTCHCDEPQMKGGRNRRRAMLPKDIADRLQVLQMPASMEERMLARIPIRRRKQLAARRLARLEKKGPAKDITRKEPLSGGKKKDADTTGGSRPKDRKHGVSGLNLMIGGGGDGRGHRRAVPRRGFPK